MERISFLHGLTVYTTLALIQDANSKVVKNIAENCMFLFIAIEYTSKPSYQVFLLDSFSSVGWQNACGSNIGLLGTPVVIHDW